MCKYSHGKKDIKKGIVYAEHYIQLQLRSRAVM